ncbi:hypothetical protein B0H13DRAFT_2227701 [Mycena leptocephala]|nr:hypothetical protein B0H13DRAFT_2227701 [Mycena leptocephala]
MSAAKPHPLLANYLQQLALHPLRTKAITPQRYVLGSNIAHMPVKKPARDAPALIHLLARSHIDLRAVKMAIYGFLVSAPISHFLQFARRPIQTTAYLASMAVISGAKSVDEVVNTIKAGFFSVIRITWITSPIALTIAQRFVPVELWVPFFNAVQFILGTYFNARVKQLRLAALAKQEKEKEETKKE